MKRMLVVVAALLLSTASTAAAQQKPQAIKSGTVPRQIEAQVRKLWEAFKNKDKATLSAMLDGGFRQFEEGLSTFGDKKTEVNAVDEFELISYTLSDFPSNRSDRMRRWLPTSPSTRANLPVKCPRVKAFL